MATLSLRRTAVFVSLATLMIVGSSYAGSSNKHAKEAPSLDIVDTAVAAGSFETLVAAVQAAGLVETLKGEGPFTVFAPTDEAFAKLPAGTVDALLADKEKLTAILTYHVVPGALASGEVVAQHALHTVQGGKLEVATKGGVTIGGAGLVQADIATSNGVIHVIDTVLLPGS